MSFLFNSKLFNGLGSRFNGGNSAETVYPTDSVAFEGVSLNDGTSVVLTEYPVKGPVREVLGGDIPRDDGKYQTGEYYRETGILLRGYLKAASKSDMAALMDTLSQTLSEPQGDLDVIEDDGTVKRFIATCVNWEDQFSDRKRHNLDLVPFTFKFVSYAMPKARAYTSYYTALTGSGNQSVVNSGTYKAKPVFVLVFSAASSVTAVTVRNETTGEQITYTGSVAAGDVLKFDSEMVRVLDKNGDVLDYSGCFPELRTGVNVISVTITGTSASYGLTTKWKKTYVR